LNSSDGAEALAAIEKEIALFLRRGETVVPPRKVAIEPTGVGELAGFYRDVTPDGAIVGPLAGLGGLEVAERDGSLFARDRRVRGVRDLYRREPWVRYVSVGAGAFQSEGDLVSTVVFTRSPDGRRGIVSALGYLEIDRYRSSAVVRISLAVSLIVLLSVLALIPGCLWLMGRPGAVDSSLAAILMPGCGAASLLLMWAVATWSREPWGKMNATTIALWAFGWAFAGFVAMSLGATTWAWVRPAALPLRLYALLASVASLVVAVFGWNAGWIGLRTWRW
jgi:hypothetical protein